jgi:hypothetical protein
VTIRAVAGGTLHGSAEVTTTPVVPIGEGLGPEVLLGPGQSRLFSFEVSHRGLIGVGVRADADRVDVALLSSTGRPLGRGSMQMPTLEPGAYLLALSSPTDAAPVRARPAVVGLVPPDTGPSEDVVRQYVQASEESGTSFTARPAEARRLEARRREGGRGEGERRPPDEPPRRAEPAARDHGAAAEEASHERARGRSLSLVLSAAPGPLLGQSRRPPHRPAGGPGTVVAGPLLRPWDPITVFFDRDAGPAKGGPEDQPEHLVQLSPAQPGAYTWLDARTLQFRPAEAWPALTRFRCAVAGTTTTLATLMEAPTETDPAAGAEGLEPVEQVALTFATPLDPAALARMVSLELRPLPGVDRASGRVLSPDDYEIKVVERKGRADAARYVLLLREPIPLGTRTLLRLRLALDDRQDEAFREIVFSTAEPFRVLRVGCRGSTFPVTAEARATRASRRSPARRARGRSSWSFRRTPRTSARWRRATSCA